MNKRVKTQHFAVSLKRANIVCLLLGFSWIAFSGCEASPDATTSLQNALSEPPVPPPAPAPELRPQCFDDRFMQPEALVTHNLDLLFVTDTSGSLDEERAGVAAGIDSFVAALPGTVDYQIGVMLAHGSRSSYSGRLWSASSNYPKVSKSSTMSLSTIRTNLAYNLTHVASDYYSDGGEEGLYSITQGLQGSKLAESQALGFFRPDAALAIVFVADENDICAIYPAGVTPVRDPDNLEAPAQLRDCSGITPATVLSKISAFQGDRPFVLGAVAYTNSNFPHTGENEYGWGYLDLVQLALGVSVDMATGQYSQGLADIGQLTTRKLQLIYDFNLAHPGIDPASIQVTVDGAQTGFTYSSTTHSVHIPDPGQSRSVVDINYCLRTAAPVPTPTATPTPTPTATPSPGPCIGTECGGGAVGI